MFHNMAFLCSDDRTIDAHAPYAYPIHNCVTRGTDRRSCRLICPKLMKNVSNRGLVGATRGRL
jgi:hypothetical protein